MVVLVSQSFAQSKVARLNNIRINFAGKKLDKLKLVATLDGNSKLYFPGSSQDGAEWNFKYPDSIYEHVKYFAINNRNDQDSAANAITLAAVIKTDTLKCGSCFFSRGDVSISSSFLRTAVQDKVLFKKEDGKIGSRKEYEELFFINKLTDKETLAFMEALECKYSFFYSSQGSYQDELNKYILLTKRYPTSYGLLASLSSRSNYYKSKEDVVSVFSLFSKTNRESYFGKEISRNLNMNRFDNMFLLPWKGENPEPIVKDVNKFSLVIYSASWCAPCHKQLPLVRELQSKLGEALDIVYISVDEKNTVSAWRKMVENGEIPGRSLLAFDQINKVRTKYFVKAIPYSLLVYPKGSMEVVDINSAIDRSKIYRLLGKSGR